MVASSFRHFAEPRPPTELGNFTILYRTGGGPRCQRSASPSRAPATRGCSQRVEGGVGVVRGDSARGACRGSVCERAVETVPGTQAHCSSGVGVAGPSGAEEARAAVAEAGAALSLTWLDDALAAGVAEPHAMTLSTVDAEGRPDARTLILKEVDRLGWAFASTRSSAKGRQLAMHPAAAPSFWWPARVRAVRVRGPVVQDLWRIRPRISSRAPLRRVRAWPRETGPAGASCRSRSSSGRERRIVIPCDWCMNDAATAGRTTSDSASREDAADRPDPRRAARRASRAGRRRATAGLP